MAIKFFSGIDLSNVTAGSILKVDSNGVIVAAVDGTDYNTSSGTWSDASSGNIYYNSGGVRIGTYQASVDAAAQLHVFDYQSTDVKLLIEDGNTGDASMQFKVSAQSYVMGLDNSDSDRFKLSAGTAFGSTGLTMKSTGQLGINGLPNGDLDVISASTPTLFVRTSAVSSQDAIVRIQGSRTTSTTSEIAQIRFETVDSDASGTELARISALKDTASTNVGRLEFFTMPTNGGSLSSRMTIKGDGKVGIGTNTPAGQFQSYISSTRYFGHNVNSGDLSVVSDNNASPVFKIQGTGTADLINVLDNTTNVFTVKDGGDVKIHGGDLDLRDANEEDATNVLYFNANNGNAANTSNDIGTGIVWKPDYSGYSKRSAGIMQIGEGNYFKSGLAFYTNNTSDNSTDWSERMRISKEGYVGIGTSTPGNALQVNGAAVFQDWAYAGSGLAHWGDGNTNITFDTDRVRIIAGGTTKFDSDNTYLTTTSAASTYATTDHVHSDATTSASGFMSATDKTKLDGVATNATANAGTVTTVTVGTGLDVANGTTTPSITLDLSELTDMTGSVNTSQDELILLDNGAERRKLFSEIFGSAAYSNSTAFISASNADTASELITFSKGISSDGNSKFYNWRALDNSSNSGNFYWHIGTITGSQSTRFMVTIAGRSTSYSDNALPAMGHIVGQLNNDNNYDIVFYNHSTASSEVVTQVGIVDDGTDSVHLYVKTGNYAEITATAHISDGRITTNSNSSADGTASAPDGYATVTEYTSYNSGNLTAGQNVSISSGVIASSHPAIGQTAGTYGSTANGTKIDSITIDENGHVTNVATGATGNMTGFFVEDGDGTEVQITNAKEWKFVEGTGIDINWTDTSNGSDADPYDLTFAVKNNSIGIDQLNVSDGSSGQALSTNGNGTLSFSTFLTSVAFSDLTSTPTTVSGYGITDAVSSSDVAFSLSGNDITIGDSITLAGGLSYNSSTNTLSQTDNNTTYSVATTSANGLMSSADKTKIDGIATGADVTPSWVPASDPSYLTSYTETDTLDTVADRGATTNQTLTVGGITTGGTVTADVVSLTNDATNTFRHRVSVYDSGGTSYGMMLWNTNGTSGDWGTMIYGPNQSNRRISFGKVNTTTPTNHSHVSEIAHFDLDNSSLNLTGDLNVDGGDVKITKQNDAPTLTLLHDGTNPSTNDLLFKMQFQSDYDGAHQNWGKIQVETNSSSVRTDMDFYVKSTSGSEQIGLRIAGQASETPKAFFYNDVDVDGTLSATAKSFDIEHPTKEGKRLVYGSLEGAEHGVYFRGKGAGEVIELPDHWTGLVHEDSVTVQLTPIGKNCVWVEDIKDNSVHVGMDNDTPYFYFIQAERKDIDKLIVEQDA